MKGKVEQGHSSCEMEGLRGIITAGRQISVFLKLSKGSVPLSRITREDGEDLRRKEKQMGWAPHSVPGFWWYGDEKDTIEFWPMAAKDFNIIGVPHGNPPSSD